MQAEQLKALIAQLDSLKEEAERALEAESARPSEEDLVAAITSEVVRTLRSDSNLRRQHATPRQWTLHQKKAILAEIEIARSTGVRGAVQAILDKHELASANVAQWRQQLRLRRGRFNAQR